MKKRMKRITATWRNGCLEKVDDHPVHTIPNHHPAIMNVLSKTFVQIILPAKWLVRHSSKSPQPTATTFAFSSSSLSLFYVNIIPGGLNCEGVGNIPEGEGLSVHSTQGYSPLLRVSPKRWGKKRIKNTCSTD